jgi:hypothetical protein
MKLFKDKTYTVFELGVLKTCVMCVGLILGAYFSPYVKMFLWVIVPLGVVTYIRAMYFYWRDKP